MEIRPAPLNKNKQNNDVSVRDSDQVHKVKDEPKRVSSFPSSRPSTKKSALEVNLNQALGILICLALEEQFKQKEDNVEHEPW